MKKGTTIIPPVGAVIRLTHKKSRRFWKVTGIHLGATDCENLATLKTLDHENGTAYGKTVHEATVPISILSTHPLIEIV